MIPLIFGWHLLDPALLHSKAYLVLVTFVALNTLAYATLSLLKIVPRPRWPRTLLSKTDPRNRRAETRSIYPDGR